MIPTLAVLLRATKAILWILLLIFAQAVLPGFKVLALATDAGLLALALFLALAVRAMRVILAGSKTPLRTVGTTDMSTTAVGSAWVSECAVR